MSVISNAKEIADLIKKLGDIELYRKIIELEGEIIELTRENHSLDERVQELTNILKLKESMIFKRPFYYKEGDATPYCANCWETNHMAVHMIIGETYQPGVRYTCPNCKNMLYINKQDRP